ncbi:Zinc-binding dehydrogenase [Ceratobasidium sp. AG-Ba]|nr:Zinc-binding dehydrogenase [Ceratobasidium sp. AG-Ba]
MSRQKASIIVTKYGKPEVGTRPVPIPQAKQVLVKVTAAAVNPADWKAIEYGVLIDKFPAVSGNDGAGIIESIGPEVAGLKQGDRVFFQGTFTQADRATFQQYTLVDTEVLAKVPSNISDDQASTIPVASVTALFGLFEKSGIAFPKNGPTCWEVDPRAWRKLIGWTVWLVHLTILEHTTDRLLTTAIQLARIAGFSPIATTASAQHADFLESLGATHVFDRDVDVKKVQGVFGSSISFIFDAVSIHSTQKLGTDIINSFNSSDAHFAMVEPLDSSLQEELQGKATIHHVFAGTPDANKTLSVPYWQVLSKWIKEGKIVPNRVQVVGGGLEAVPEALELSKKGVSGVKLVVHPQE